MGLILLLDGNKSAPHAISALKRRQCRSRTSVSRPNVESEDVEGPTKDCSPSCVCICPNHSAPILWYSGRYDGSEALLAWARHIAATPFKSSLWPRLDWWRNINARKPDGRRFL